MCVKIAPGGQCLQFYLEVIGPLNLQLLLNLKEPSSGSNIREVINTAELRKSTTLEHSYDLMISKNISR